MRRFLAPWPALVLTVQARIRRAKETDVLLERLLHKPTLEDVVELHELHARHLLELGDVEGAARAHKRAEHARSHAAAHSGSSGEGEATQVQFARAALQRADAALHCAVEGTERSEATAARERSGRAPAQQDVACTRPRLARLRMS